MFCRTSDPVRDAEESQQQPQDVFTRCGMCGGDIYREDSLHYGTPYYRMEDMDVCEGCIEGYLMEKRRCAPCL